MRDRGTSFYRSGYYYREMEEKVLLLFFFFFLPPLFLFTLLFVSLFADGDWAGRNGERLERFRRGFKMISKLTAVCYI